MGFGDVLRNAFDIPKVTEDGLKYQIVKDEIKIVGYKKSSNIQQIPSHIEDMPVGIISGLAGIRLSGEVSIPDTVHTIEYGALGLTKHITKIIVPDSVKKIIGDAFDCNESLTEVILPDTVDLSEAQGLLQNCDKLKQLHLPSGMTKIPVYFLAGCRSLEEITIPDGVTEICEMAFWQCEKLHTVHLPESLKIIGKMAFADCTALKDIQLSLGLQEVGEDAFAGCPAMETSPITDIGGI